MFTLIGATAHGTEDREQNDFMQQSQKQRNYFLKNKHSCMMY